MPGNAVSYYSQTAHPALSLFTHIHYKFTYLEIHCLPFLQAVSFVLTRSKHTAPSWLFFINFTGSC